MALPESFQIALQRAQTERELEQEQVLTRIGETVRSGVPLLSGVIAGALSRNPIIGVGTAFIADKLKERNEQKREQRKASRLEMRQRKEAAKIAVREGQFQNEKEALQAIEANRIAQEQENTKQREQSILQQFGLNQEQEQVQDQQEENVEQQEVVREPQQTGLALETTLAHVDSEISGIADLLLDRFADEEDRFEKAEDRRELQAAKLRETISESARKEKPSTAPVRDRRRVRNDNLFSASSLGRFLPTLGLGIIATGIATAVASAASLIVSAITGLATGLASAMTSALKRGGFLPSRPSATPSQVPPTQGQRTPPQTLPPAANDDPNRSRPRPGTPVQTTPSPNERVPGQPERQPRVGGRGIMVGGGKLAAIALLAAGFYDFLTEEDPNLIGFKEIFSGIKNFFTDEDQQIPQGQPDDPNDVVGGFGLDEQASLSNPIPQQPAMAGLGSEMAKVSLATVASAQPIVIAPMDASTQVQSTTFNNSKSFAVFGGSTRNEEVRGKFLQA